jgi:hypothetical protein
MYPTTRDAFVFKASMAAINGFSAVAGLSERFFSVLAQVQGHQLILGAASAEALED